MLPSPVRSSRSARWAGSPLLVAAALGLLSPVALSSDLSPRPLTARARRYARAGMLAWTKHRAFRAELRATR